MNKIILVIVTILMLVSCTKTTYEIKYIDTANPTDTLSAQVRIPERITFKGEDLRFDVIARNEGMSGCPIMIYTLKGTSFITVTGPIHKSLAPITIVEYHAK